MENESPRSRDEKNWGRVIEPTPLVPLSNFSCHQARGSDARSQRYCHPVVGVV